MALETDADCIQIQWGGMCRKPEVLTPLWFGLASGQSIVWLSSACISAFLAAESRYSSVCVVWDKEADSFLVVV